MTPAQGITFLATLGLIGVAVVPVDTQETARGEWPYFGGDRAFTHYSPLGQITRDNVHDLQVVWRREAVLQHLHSCHDRIRALVFISHARIVEEWRAAVLSRLRRYPARGVC